MKVDLQTRTYVLLVRAFALNERIVLATEARWETHSGLEAQFGSRTPWEALLGSVPSKVCFQM